MALRGRVAAALAAVVMSAAAVGPAAAAVGHLLWLHTDDVWTEWSTVVDTNRDGVDDVVVASGDRMGSLWLAGGNPAALVNQFRRVGKTPARLVAHDGRDGGELWSVEWRGATGPGESSASVDVHGLVVIPGGAAPAVLVSRTTYDDVEGGWVAVDRLTLYDATDGSVLWERVDEHAETWLSHELITLDLPSGPAVVLTTAASRNRSPSSMVELLGVGAAGLERLASHHLAPDIVPKTAAVPTGDGVRVFLAELDTTTGFGQYRALRALDFVPVAGGWETVAAWQVPDAAGWHLAASGGDEPLLVVASEHGTTAHDPATGAVRWRHDARLGRYSAGGLLLTDGAAPGVPDVALSPTFGTGYWTAYDPYSEEDSSAEIVLLDGRDGSERWRLLEPAAKFGALSLALADLDGQGPALLASFTHQDGFAFVGHFDDDPGLVAAYNLADGARLCRFSTDRTAPHVLLADLVGEREGSELVVPTLGGNLYAFQPVAPACGALALGGGGTGAEDAPLSSTRR